MGADDKPQDAGRREGETMISSAIRQVIVSQGVQMVGWVFAGAILYAIHTFVTIQMPVLANSIVNRIDSGYQSATDRFTKAQLEFSEDFLEAARLRSSDLNKTLEQFRADEIEDRRLLVEVLRRSNMDSESLSEAIEAASKAGDVTMPEVRPPPRNDTSP